MVIKKKSAYYCLCQLILASAGILFCTSSPAQNLRQLWGMASSAGDSGGGVIFQYNAETIKDSIAHPFTIPGANPIANLIQANDGNFYGMTPSGGASGLGTIFKCTPNGKQTILYSFAGGIADGANPNSSLIQGGDGNFYGLTTEGGDSGIGTIFKCTPTGAETILHTFTRSTTDGCWPLGSLIQAIDGNFYGLTSWGGTSGLGTIFKCTSTGEETILYSFTGGVSDGANPYGSLIQGTDGNLYGMTKQGGTANVGTIFKCSTTGNEVMLHAFAGGSSDGEYPYGSLIQGIDGNLYGMTTGDLNGWTINTLCQGAIFKCTTSGDETILYNIGFSGSYPRGNLIQGNDSNFYGMISEGGVMV